MKGSFSTSVTPSANPVKTYPAAQSASYTTTACATCVVKSNNVVVPAEYRVEESNSFKIPTPGWNMQSCYGSRLLGYQFTVLPTKGTLCLDTVPIVVNQVVSAADFPKLIYNLAAVNEVDGTDTATFQAKAECGSSSNYTVTFNMVKYVDDSGCVNCGTTTHV